MPLLDRSNHWFIAISQLVYLFLQVTRNPNTKAYPTLHRRNKKPACRRRDSPDIFTNPILSVANAGRYALDKHYFRQTL